MNSQKIIGLADATLATDALNRQTADGRYYLSTTRLNNITIPNASVALGGNKITGLANPTLSGDAATKAYVDTRTPFRTAIIDVGILNLSTTPTAVTSVSGFVTSATKASTPYGGGGNLVVITYPNAGYIPMIMVTPRITSDITANLEQ